MKKFIVYALILTAFILSATTEAESRGEVRTHLSFTSVYSAMELPVGGSTLQDSTVLLGPTLTITKGKYYLQGTFMMTTSEYEFNLGGGQMINASRQDIITELGYYFTEVFAVHAGIRHSSIDMELWNGGTLVDIGSITTTGPVAGVGARKELADSGIILNGDVSVMVLYTESQLPTQSTEEDTNYGYSIRGGAAFPVSKKVLLNLGYLYEVILQDEDELVFSGVTLNVGYRFY